jgi:hypothetical protein
LHPQVDWPNAWEGGRVTGSSAVREYWVRQFAAISSNVEPERFTVEPDGAVTVDVHQVVHDSLTGELISDSRVRHRYRFENELIVRMDVLEPSAQRFRDPNNRARRPGFGTEAEVRPRAC